MVVARGGVAITRPVSVRHAALSSSVALGLSENRDVPVCGMVGSAR